MLLDVHREVMKFSSKHFLRDCDSKCFNVNFHGVNLQFRFRSEALLEELRSYFPKAWWLSDKESCPLLVVHWSAPSEFNLRNIEQWAQLSSPDCYETSFFDDSWVVQRDFMARELGSEESVTTLCLLSSLEVNDGLFNFLRYYLPKYLLPLKKILLHSSCV